jgi:hypothetical protein
MMHARSDRPESDDARLTASLAGLAVTLALLVGGLVLVHGLHAQAQLEDCLLAGWRVCTVPLAR